MPGPLPGSSFPASLIRAEQPYTTTEASHYAVGEGACGDVHTHTRDSWLWTGNTLLGLPAYLSACQSAFPEPRRSLTLEAQTPWPLNSGRRSYPCLHPYPLELAVLCSPGSGEGPTTHLHIMSFFILLAIHTKATKDI